MGVAVAVFVGLAVRTADARVTASSVYAVDAVSVNEQRQADDAQRLRI